MAGQTTTDISGPIVLYKSDSVGGHNIHVFSYPDLLEQFAFPFHFEPEIFEIAESEFFIAGHDTIGDYSLYHFSALQDTLLAVYHLNDSASNAQEFLKIGDSLFFLSSPGDSMVVLTALNTAGGQLYQTVVYSQSGARATNNEYKGQQQFTFQPVSDTSGASLDKQILTLNPVSYTHLRAHET